MKLAISMLTCDRVELTRQSIKPLLEGTIAGRYHLFICDGSTSEENEKAIWEMSYPAGHMIANVRGGAGAAIVYALTMMLAHEENYDAVGLIESDVLLLDGWLAVLDLFSQGAADGLAVGCGSARCFVDRVLFQKDRFAVMHNTGAGCIILTRQAAQIVLDTFRTGWTTDNRRIFSQLCGVDIASYWAFRANEHALTADWHWDATLAAHGLASLALTPSPCEMIGQVPPLNEQGLHIVGAEPTGFEIPSVHDEEAFDRYRDSLRDIGEGRFSVGVETKFWHEPNNGTWTYFPHQMAMLGGTYVGDWKLRELRGWGTFGWEAYGTAALSVPVFGTVGVLVSGGKTGGKVEIADDQSGFKAEPELPPEGDTGQVLQTMVPGGLNYRNIRITALTPGVVFYGLQSREKQPCLPNVSFDHSTLPPS